jgi:hypothetical protein
VSQHFTMSQQLSASLDAWINRQPDPKPTRPDAIRQLIEAGVSRQVDDKPGAPSGGNPGSARKPASATPAKPISKEAQIRALREQGAEAKPI